MTFTPSRRGHLLPAGRSVFSPNTYLRRAGFVLAFGAMLGVAPAQAQKKKEEKKEQPQVVVAVPLSVSPGKTSKLIIRGLKIDDAKEIKFADDKQQGTWKIIKKSKVAVPNNQDPKKLGDSQLDVELTLPAEPPVGEVAFIVTTDKGTTAAHKLLVGSPFPLLREKEGNNGFQQAQPIAVPQVVEGLIQSAQDVDVFKIDGKKGQKLLIEVQAGRLGAPLDPILTLYDGGGAVLARNDDIDGASAGDARLEVTLAADGPCYLSLMDAHDQGGPTHAYRLTIQTPN